MFREEENFPFSFGTWSLKGCFVALKSVFAVTLREQGWTDDVGIPKLLVPKGMEVLEGLDYKGNNYSWGLV
jgi:hypothetical protein